MAKNFTEIELKLARDKIYELADCGRLHGATALSDSEIGKIAGALNKAMDHRLAANQPLLSRRATEILLAAVAENKPLEIISKNALHLDSDLQSPYTLVRCGLQEFLFWDVVHPRIPHEVEELLRAELLTDERGSLVPSEKAFRMLQLAGTRNDSPSYFVKKIKCLECDPHFTVYTFYPDRHGLESLHCPECGQNSGHFMIWWQKEPGFIFQTVPGSATFYAYG